MIDASQGPPRTARSRLLAALALVALGAPGIASLLLVAPPVEGVPRALLLVNPTILLVAFALIGAWAAPAAGFRSRIADSIAGGSDSLIGRAALAALGLGIAAGFAIGLLDHLGRGLWQVSPGLPPSLPQSWAPLSLAFGVAYGGIVEEITMRWGLMSLLVVGIWKLAARRSPAPPGWTVRAGIVVAALLFAAGHLPTLAAFGAPLEPALVARTLLWNGLLGVLFGIVFARHDLEAAMACHAGCHIGFAPAALVAGLLG